MHTLMEVTLIKSGGLEDQVLTPKEVTTSKKVSHQVLKALSVKRRKKEENSDSVIGAADQLLLSF